MEQRRREMQRIMRLRSLLPSMLQHQASSSPVQGGDRWRGRRGGDPGMKTMARDGPGRAGSRAGSCSGTSAWQAHCTGEALHCSYSFNLYLRQGAFAAAFAAGQDKRYQTGRNSIREKQPGKRVKLSAATATTLPSAPCTAAPSLQEETARATCRLFSRCSWLPILQ